MPEPNETVHFERKTTKNGL